MKKRRRKTKYPHISRHGKDIAILMAVVFVAGIFWLPQPKDFLPPLYIEAEASTIKELEEKIRIAKEEEKKAAAAKAASEEAKQGMEQKNRSLRNVLADLDAELAEVSANLAQLEVDIITKEHEMDQAELELAEAIAIKDKQYADMKTRVIYLYERNDAAYLELLFTAESFSEFLNYADYIEQLAQYDQMKLEEFVAIQRLVTELLEYLTAQRIELGIMKENVLAEEARVANLVEETRRTINHYRNQISQTEQEILALEAEMKRQADERAEFEKELAEQIRLRDLAAQSVWRNIADVQFAEGDRYLLASIIYCEAGAEPYAGQLAVGAVVINRLLSPVFPDTLSGVVYQNRQFSPVASGRLALAMAEGRATAACYRAADEAMAGASNVGNCLFFRTPIAGLQGTQIGNHIFY